jgi:Co/Zn/Cd efflux system component
MKKTTFHISKMDCPSEERIIRMKLEDTSVKEMTFDIPNRLLTVYHDSEPQYILDKLVPLNFGTTLKDSVLTETNSFAGKDDASESKVLKILLAINATMFVLEFATGILADSLGLVSDSIDMLADALVYGLSLYAVGKAIGHKKFAAKMSGYFQLLLAIGVCAEAVRRFIYGAEPESGFMIAVSAIALAANVSCLLLLSKHKEGEVHMKASWIFSANDVIANVGVIVAGILVMLTKSSIPDLVVGIIVAGVVARGAFSILNLSK